MSRYAIVGGAGFIGSHFVDHLALNGHEVKVVDNLCSGTLSRIQNHIRQPYFEFLNIEASDTGALALAFNNVDTVIHLASNPDIAAAMTNPRIDFTQGTALTESVVEAVRIAGVKTVLYASGSGVYGDVSFKPIKESDQLLPVSPYGASKLAGESLMSAYAYMFDFKAIAFRFANVIGPRQTHGVGYDFLNKLRNNCAQLEILGDGTQTKSYIHVSDIVVGVLHAERNLSNFYDVFNIATTDYLSVLEIADMAINAMGLDRSQVALKLGDSDRGWKGDVPKIQLDSSKLRNLGWNSVHTSREAMKLALDEMSSHLNFE
jgi:UDP-glucose 4-epimerase